MSIDNWGSVIMFFWIDYKYPVLSTASDFMQLKQDNHTKNAANVQALVALLCCLVSLVTVSISGKTFIDYSFDHLREKEEKNDVFHFVILGLLVGWYIFSYIISRCFFKCYAAAEKKKEEAEKANTTINEGGDSERGDMVMAIQYD